MGKAQILSGGANGFYTVRLDYGETERTAELAQIAAQLIDLNNKSLAVGSQVNAVDGEIATAQSAVSTAISNYEAAILANQPLAPFEQAIRDAQSALAAAVAKKAPLASEKARIDGQIKNTQGRQSLLENLSTQQTKSVWCVDLTEDASGQVGTIEIPGEPNKTLLVPGAVAPTAADGKVLARELMRYDQLFVNAALLPGWQKFRPTYRTGTITNINGDVCTVNLDLAESSAQNLNVNQTNVFNNVPIQYLECNGEAFDDGDRVVVKFEGQNWASPKVIGFVNNPKSCNVFYVFDFTGSAYAYYYLLGSSLLGIDYSSATTTSLPSYTLSFDLARNTYKTELLSLDIFSSFALGTRDKSYLMSLNTASDIYQGIVDGKFDTNVVDNSPLSVRLAFNNYDVSPYPPQPDSYDYELPSATVAKYAYGSIGGPDGWIQWPIKIPSVGYNTLYIEPTYNIINGEVTLTVNALSDSSPQLKGFTNVDLGGSPPEDEFSYYYDANPSNQESVVLSSDVLTLNSFPQIQGKSPKSILKVWSGVSGQQTYIASVSNNPLDFNYSPRLVEYGGLCYIAVEYE